MIPDKGFSEEDGTVTAAAKKNDDAKAAVDAAVEAAVEAAAGGVDAALEAGAQASADLAKLREELADANDRALRAQAEVDNILKRARREIDEERRFANLPLLRDLLPVLDNIGRAIDAAAKSDDAAGLLTGVKMVAQQLEAMLQGHHCQKIAALEHPFDPHCHQAISQQPSAEHPENTVVMVVQEGYRLHDRVIRPAQVIVSKAPPAAET